MRWEVKNKLHSQDKNEKFKIDELIDLLLKNRNITSPQEREAFLHPKLEKITAETVGIDKKELSKTVQRIKKAIRDRQQIIVFGDYDVDGISGSAILWEALYLLGAKVMPYIPHRIDEGYGLSVVGIKNILSEQNPRADLSKTKLIITVDNGIVANEAVTYANEQGIDVIITDHHLPHVDEEHKKPDAFAIVHTTKLCGAGVAWVLTKEFLSDSEALQKEHMTDHLVFASLATVADMVPLVDANRAIVKHGLQELRKTSRVGLRALFDEAGVDQRAIEIYQIGHVISPRLNAAGRMESAMDSLRLLCTKDARRAKELARELGEVNKFRQQEMTIAAEHAIGQIVKSKSQMAKILFIADESYPQGVIGLVAGKLVEKYYRPAIVIAIGETHSKASVRSVKGFNVIEFLRLQSDYFVNVGGHPMAAGFTVETAKISILQDVLEKAAEEAVTGAHLEKSLSIECELPVSAITQELNAAISSLSPFGVGNPEPVFYSEVVIKEVRLIGREGKHLKLKLSSTNDQGLKTNDYLEAVGFGMGERLGELQIGQAIDVAYTLDKNEWNGRVSLQLKLKDIKKSTT